MDGYGMIKKNGCKMIVDVIRADDPEDTGDGSWPQQLCVLGSQYRAHLTGNMIMNVIPLYQFKVLT